MQVYACGSEGGGRSMQCALLYFALSTTRSFYFLHFTARDLTAGIKFNTQITGHVQYLQEQKKGRRKYCFIK